MTKLNHRGIKLGLSKIWGLSMLVLGSGCTGAAPEDAGEGTGADQSALSTPDGDPFKPWVTVTDRNGMGASAIDDPGICFSRNGYVVFQRDSSLKYKSVTWDSSGIPDGSANPRASVWSTWTGTRNFKSKPACANLDPVDVPTQRTYKIVLAGVDTADHIFTSSAQANAVADGSAPDVPSGITPWVKVSDRTFASGPSISVGSNLIIVVGRGKVDNRIYAFRRSLPYDTGTWSFSVPAPPLPSPYTAKGSPALAYTMGEVNQFTVMVRAQDATFGQRYFRAHFDGFSWTGWDAIGSWGPAGDPALEFSTDVNLLTLYSFGSGRAGLFPAQQSGIDLTWFDWMSIRSSEVPGAFGGPAVQGFWGPVEGEGIHRVVVRMPGGSLRVTEANLVQLDP